MNPSASTNDQSKRRMIIVVAVIVAALTIIGSIIALSLSSSRNSDNASRQQATNQQGTATVEGFRQDVSELTKALETAKKSAGAVQSTAKENSTPTAGGTTSAKLKESLTKELDRRIHRLDDTLASLRAATIPAAITGSSPDDPQVTSDFKESVQNRSASLLMQLRNTKAKVTSASSVAELKSLAQAVDSQALLTQAIIVQGASTKAAIDFNDLVSRLEGADTTLQAQLAKIKECARGSDNNTGSDISTSGCEEFAISSEEVATDMEKKLEAVRMSTETIATTVSSATLLLTTLSTNLDVIMTQLGDVAKLGDISKQTKVGNLNGLITSFTAIGSQLDLAHVLSQAALVELASIFDQMTS